MKSNNRKRGFTIAEVVVAMAVVTIVSIVTISLIERCRTISVKSMYYAEAREITDNSLEMFKFSDSEDAFLSNIVLIGNNYTVDNHTYVFKNNVYELLITVKYSELSDDTFEAFCYSNDGKQVFKCSYHKR